MLIGTQEAELGLELQVFSGEIQGVRLNFEAS